MLGPLLCLVTLLAPPPQGGALAPDGEPGFGPAPDAGEVLGMFRKARGAEAELVAGLWDLPGDVRTEMAIADRLYRARGYYAIVPARGRDLEGLHERFRTLGSATFAGPVGREEALAWARTWFDQRFRLRSELWGEAAVDLAELERALELLVAGARGLAYLTPGEVGLIAVRADIAASRLRALRQDLHSLAEDPRDVPADAPEVAALADAIEGADPAGIELMRGHHDRLERLRERMGEGLAITRLRPKLALGLSARQRDRAAARAALEELRALLPFTAEGAAAGEPIASMRKIDRYRRAVGVAELALTQDPFHDELNYLLAEAWDFQAGIRYARPYYDRFLALRGVRHYEYASYAERDLDRRELRSLARVNAADGG